MKQTISDHSGYVVPLFDQWHITLGSFQQRIQNPKQRELLETMVARQFLTAQAICRGVDLSASNNWLGTSSVIEHLRNETAELLQQRQMVLAADGFGWARRAIFDARSFLALWCLTLEFATLASPGSCIEVSIGNLPTRMEMEVGSDCRCLETGFSAQSPALEFVCRIFPEATGTSLNCPVGGAAIQLCIPGNSVRQTRAA
ncbi:MAG: hypothetical protein ACR2NP_11975 [Pirellulaceae bacterium]